MQPFVHLIAVDSANTSPLLLRLWRHPPPSIVELVGQKLRMIRIDVTERQFRYYPIFVVRMPWMLRRKCRERGGAHVFPEKGGRAPHETLKSYCESVLQDCFEGLKRWSMLFEGPQTFLQQCSSASCVCSSGGKHLGGVGTR